MATKGRWLWTRTIGSTLAGEGLDSLVFMTLAFVGTMPMVTLSLAILTQWVVKSAYEAAVTPVTYVVVNFLKRKEGMDVFDCDTRFNPLLFGEYPSGRNDYSQNSSETIWVPEHSNRKEMKKKAVFSRVEALIPRPQWQSPWQEGYEVYSLSFRYGQRHVVEIESARRIG